MNNKVLACIDHSSYTTAICDYAAWAALRLEAPLEFIHVLDRHPEKAAKLDFSGSIGLGTQESLLEELSSLDEQRSRLAQEGGRQLLEAAKKRAVADGVPSPESRQRHGELVETLAELEHTARLFIVGQRGEAADLAPQHIGSNLERVIRALHRPILVSPKEFRIVRNVLIAFDGSATARKGIDMLASSPLLRGCMLHIVMAASSTAATNEAVQWANNTLASENFPVKASIVAGEADSVLTEYISANQIDMLAMGAYGHSRIRQLLVGSTTTTMIRTLSIPILILR
jgi:nucleotide-binding universal stress UspA family protein